MHAKINSVTLHIYSFNVHFIMHDVLIDPKQQIDLLFIPGSKQKNNEWIWNKKC